MTQRSPISCPLDVSPHYDIGTPQLKDIWVDPISGDDGADGSTRSQALRTLARAWRMIPLHIEGHGWRIMLAPGRYEPHIADQIMLEDRQGTRECPHHPPTGRWTADRGASHAGVLPLPFHLRP